MLTGLQFVLIHVPSIAAVKSFYTETLGFTVEDEQPGFVQFAQPAGATFAISEGGTGDHRSSTELWWFVDDADATYNELRERGATIAQELQDMPFGRTFAVGDPAGHTLYMLQPRGN